MPRNTDLFVIPEEPPLTPEGLPLPPGVTDGFTTCLGAACLKFREGTCDGGVRGDIHHLLWEAKLYTTRTQKSLRTLAALTVKRCRHFHDALHTIQAPPPKPSKEVTKLAVTESDLREKIADKYRSIRNTEESIDAGSLKNPKAAERRIAQHQEQIDEYKEELGLLLGSSRILPTQYWVVENGNVVIRDMDEDSWTNP